MWNWLQHFSQSKLYWVLVMLVGVSLEGIALFYQYVLDEPPCVLCIQARVWVLLGILVAIVMLFVHRVSLARIVGHLGLVVSLALLLNRSWIALLVERGQYDGQCGMDAGFPGWLPLDAWLPQMFEVQTMCGYTPMMPFGVSMGEALTGGSLILLMLALVVASIDVVTQYLPGSRSMTAKP